MKSLFGISVLTLQILYTALCTGQNKDFRIAGQITTVENQVLTGDITWNGNKMYWIDFFEASKTENPYARYFKNSGISFKSNNHTSDIPSNHSFYCRFGDIRKIRLTAPDQIELQIKDGHSIRLKKGEANDIGSPVRIHTDREEIKIEWEKISEIEFKPGITPENSSPDIPLTGVVKTQQGLYKGAITWNGTVKTINDTLAGINTAGNTPILFRNINKIVKDNSTVFQVSLKNGNTLFIEEEPHPNRPDRGVLVNMPNTGSVFIPWKNFKFMETTGLNEISMLTYNDFKTPERIHGEVLTRKGQKIKGVLAYNLDQSMGIETLDGKNDNISYRIPFRYISSIEPKNYNYSFIRLRNGSGLSLGDSADVSHENDGIMVFIPNENAPTYIPWEEIKLITLE